MMATAMSLFSVLSALRLGVHLHGRHLYGCMPFVPRALLRAIHHAAVLLRLDILFVFFEIQDVTWLAVEDGADGVEG